MRSLLPFVLAAAVAPEGIGSAPPADVGKAPAPVPEALKVNACEECAVALDAAHQASFLGDTGAIILNGKSVPKEGAPSCEVHPTGNAPPAVASLELAPGTVPRAATAKARAATLTAAALAAAPTPPASPPAPPSPPSTTVAIPPAPPTEPAPASPAAPGDSVELQVCGDCHAALVAAGATHNKVSNSIGLGSLCASHPTGSAPQATSIVDVPSGWLSGQAPSPRAVTVKARASAPSSAATPAPVPPAPWASQAAVAPSVRGPDPALAEMRARGTFPGGVEGTLGNVGERPEAFCGAQAREQRIHATAVELLSSWSRGDGTKADDLAVSNAVIVAKKLVAAASTSAAGDDLVAAVVSTPTGKE